MKNHEKSLHIQNEIKVPPTPPAREGKISGHSQVTVVQLTWRAFFSASATAVITSHRMPILDFLERNLPYDRRKSKHLKCLTDYSLVQIAKNIPNLPIFWVLWFSKHPRANFKPPHTPTHAAWYCSESQHVHDRHRLTTLKLQWECGISLGTIQGYSGNLFGPSTKTKT